MMKKFNLFDKPKSVNLLVIGDIKRSGIQNYNVDLEYPVDNQYVISTISDIRKEFHDSFIYDGVYCCNMNSYVFVIGDCTPDFFDALCHELIDLILTYGVDPSDMKFAFESDVNLTHEQQVKFGKIFLIDMMVDSHTFA